ncbi:APH(3') family aminoglycoside O-phosphotransferase [Cohnella nanjingensis]|uniref:Aminoglycoside 3'-phosphotransferase n=1 Tax=Cohnella nanjingensis TaxID=1387779 RepID=A0A7X0RT02_9BACL|nr:APH(3') family aminoglycoside O-phosphotransferase [Cohnella nanjingensis]MBB6671644.1 aminoglycoside 3'-phosphotransferase [Cohnella nanjingensis]
MIDPQGLQLPAKLSERLKDSDLTPNQVGQSGASVYRVDRVGGTNASAYLKVAPSSWHAGLQSEAQALRWLQGRFPAPRGLHFETFEGCDYLLMTELPGRDGSDTELLAEPEAMVRLYAESLKALHALDIRDCPLDQRLEKKLYAAWRIVREGLADDDVEAENAGRTPDDIYAQLLRDRPATEDLVFAHGDYCMPNLIISEGVLSGMIDLGRAGVADRYQDIALAIRSLRHNFGSDAYAELFAASYGLAELDREKVDYYILLDELF